MRRPTPLDESSRFRGQLRHYHRSGASDRRSWEEWVEGEDEKPGIGMKLLKIIGIIVVLLALGSIIAGLVIVLR